MLAALFVGVAATTAVAALSPAPPPTQPVLVAARDLPAGELLRPADLTVEQVARTPRPLPALTRTGQAVGQVLAAPLLEGEPVTSARLRGPGLLAGQGPGTLALPVRVADAAASTLLRRGALTVLDVPGAAPPSTAGVAEAVPTGGGGLVVLAVSPLQARLLVAAAADAPLWFAVHAPAGS